MRLDHPTTIAEAVAALREEDARCLAGGATLVAMMNAELLAPARLVSLRDIPELRMMHVGADAIRIGAMVTHTEVAADDRLVGPAAVVRSAAAQIAHPAIRNAGTLGGAIAHGDPAADYPGALTAAGATVHVAGPNGERDIGIDSFFVDYLETTLAPDELVTAVTVPLEPADARATHLKHARVDGDYATVSVSLVVTGEGRARVAIGSCGPRPLHLDAADQALSDGHLGDAAVAAAGELLAAAADPIDDVRGSAAYRRRLIPRLLGRAVAAVKEGGP